MLYEYVVCRRVMSYLDLLCRMMYYSDIEDVFRILLWPYVRIYALFTYSCAAVCIIVCMDVHAHVLVYVLMHVCVYHCMYQCTCTCISVCIDACM